MKRSKEENQIRRKLTQLRREETITQKEFEAAVTMFKYRVCRQDAIRRELLSALRKVRGAS